VSIPLLLIQRYTGVAYTHMLQKLTYNFAIALESMAHNKMRSFLTSLGIVFGVASVIAMLAIGKGAEQEILEQMKLLGTNNIIIKAVVEKEDKKAEEEDSKKSEKKKFSPGLTLADAEGIEQIVPAVEFVSPEVVVETMALRSGLKKTTKLVGVDREYFTTMDFQIAEGEMFSETQVQNSAPMCVIGSGIKARFFAREEPIGKQIKCGSLWLTVIGVLKEKQISEKSIEHLGIRDYNMDIYTPITTFLLRYRNRALVTKQDIMNASRPSEDDGTTQLTEEEKNYHQIDRMVVRVRDTRYMTTAADVVSRLLQRRHNQVVDYEVIVPELLLAQEQRTKDIFNSVLLAIACISLLVGGIGIMNIMLASVMERIKEIGTRLAIGATKRDILLQFVSEAVTISVLGGVGGILLGLGISFGIERLFGIITIVSPISIVLSFGVAAAVGLIFGIVPARRAAEQDPIVSLRYE
jgi:putative ABC transport system permease protein